MNIGVDIVDLTRVKRIISSKSGKHFLNHVFTNKEIEFFKTKTDPIPHIATSFAAKEVVFKALGTGWTKGQDVEILRKESGQPKVKLYNSAKNIGGNIKLSMSYSNNYAVAFAIREVE